MEPPFRAGGVCTKLLADLSDKDMMISLSNRTKWGCRPLDYKQIESRLNGAPCLPSLGSIESALKDLLSADQRYTTQIAEIIRRDPSLTSRLLHLVNSVYYGLANPIKNIEEAVFFLGVRQIRQLAMVTPIIEDFQKLTQDRNFAWRQFWRHCIGTALMTRELVDLVKSPEGESDYVSGLIHDVGKIVMSSVFPEHFKAIYHTPTWWKWKGKALAWTTRNWAPFIWKNKSSRSCLSRWRAIIISPRPRPATAKRWRRCKWLI
jgi:hypothetical protein